MSDPDNPIEQLTTKISNLENDVATLTGENNRLNSEVKSKDNIITELKETQKSLEEQVKAAQRPVSESQDWIQERERQAQHIIELETKLREYKDFEIKRLDMEKQVRQAQDHAQKLVEEAFYTMYELKARNISNQTLLEAKHELEIATLTSKIENLETILKDHSKKEETPKSEEDKKPVDGAETEEGNLKEMTDKNNKLKKKLIQEKKATKKMQEEMETMKTELYGLQSQAEEQNRGISDELDRLRYEMKEKMDLIEVLENDNRDLEQKLKKAEDAAREAVNELQQVQEQTDEQHDKFGDQDDQIAQMHEDMQRLLEFKNELEALIEEQNRDIEQKTDRISKLVNDLKLQKAEAEKKDIY